MTRHNTVKLDYKRVRELAIDTDPVERALSPETVQLAASALSALRPKWFWLWGGQKLDAVQLEELADALDLALVELLEPVVTTEPPEEGECSDYAPTAPNIIYWPNDPVSQPSLYYELPGGGLNTIWFKGCDRLGGFLGELFGCEASDVYNTLVIPYDGEEPPEANEGDFPSFTVWVQGEGTVFLRLLQIPYGGLALVVVDDNPLSLKIENLAVDILELADPEIDLIEESLCQVDLSGDYLHKVTVAFIYRITPEPPFVWYGGGLRGVTLCGEELSGEVPMPSLRVNDCVLEVQWGVDGPWIEVPGDYDLCGPDAPEFQVNPLDPCQLDISYDGGASWSPLWNICEALAPHTLVRQNEITPDKLEFSADGGEEWNQFANLSLASLNQLELRQDPDFPCLLQVSKDDGETWETFADLKGCGGFEPPEPPPETTDPDCAFAYSAAKTMRSLVLDIVNNYTEHTGPKTLALITDFVSYLTRFYSGWFVGSQLLNMYLLLLQHVGESYDFAPVLNADDGMAVDELTCGAYCTILALEGAEFTPQAWATAHLDEGAVTLIDENNDAAHELLDVAVRWLEAGVFQEGQWSILRAAWSQAEDSEIDCELCGCVEGGTPIASVWSCDAGVAYVGMRFGDWRYGMLPDWGGLTTNDYKPAGGANYRRCLEAYEELPFGTATRVELDLDVVALSEEDCYVRVWIRPQTSAIWEQVIDQWIDTTGPITVGFDLEDYPLHSLHINIISDQEALQSNLQGQCNLYAVRVTYAAGSTEAFDISDPVREAGWNDAAPLPTREFPGVYSVPCLYKGGGGDEYYGSMKTTNNECFRVMAINERPGTSDMSQSHYYQCDNSYTTFDPHDENYPPNTVQIKSFGFRAPYETTVYIILREEGTQP